MGSRHRGQRGPISSLPWRAGCNRARDYDRAREPLALTHRMSHGDAGAIPPERPPDVRKGKRPHDASPATPAPRSGTARTLFIFPLPFASGLALAAPSLSRYSYGRHPPEKSYMDTQRCARRSPGSARTRLRSASFPPTYRATPPAGWQGARGRRQGHIRRGRTAGGGLHPARPASAPQDNQP